MRGQNNVEHVDCLQDDGAKVLVCGSTGGVGQLVVAKLVQRGYDVRAVTRNKSKAMRAFEGSPKVEVFELDLRDAEAVAASNVFDGCQAVVMATGTTAFPSDRCATILYDRSSLHT